MRRLVILATKYNDTAEADKIFSQRGWRRVRDDTVVPSVKEVVRKSRKETGLIDLEIEEIEYRW
jgi:hypothetical protein